MILLIGIILILCWAVLLTAVLRERSVIAYLLCLYLLSLAKITLAGMIAGAVNQLANPLMFVALHLLFLAGAFWLWRRSGSPALGMPLLLFKENWQATWHTARKKYAGMLLLALVIALSLGLAFLLAVIVPPNSHDSLTTHMSRIGYWLQKGNYLPFATHNMRQVYYPLNPSLQVLWGIVFSGHDHFTSLPQWLAVVACMLAIMGISRILGAAKVHAVLNALLFASFPIVIMQSSTTQTDMVVAALVAGGVFFLLRALGGGEKADMLLSGMSIGLALGSKQTAFFVLPGVGILWLLVLIKRREKAHKVFMTWMIFLVLFFLLFGCLTYAINLAYFGAPFGPPGSVGENMLDVEVGEMGEMLLINGLRNFYSSIDPVGIPSPYKEYTVKLKAYVLQPLLERFGIHLESGDFLSPYRQFSYLKVPNPTEDEAWFGMLGFGLLASGIVINLWRGMRRKEPLRLGLVGIAMSYFLSILFFRPGWDPYQGRYFLSIVAIISPLICLPLSDSVVSKGTRAFIIGLAMVLTINTHFHNLGKPIHGPETVWQMDRIDKMSVQNRSYRDFLRAVYIHIPPNLPLGLCIDSGLWDYPLFEDGFTRRVIPIEPKTLINDEEWLKARSIRYILVNTNATLWESFPPYLNYFYQIGDWKFLRVRYE